MADTVRIYIASDFHAAEKAWRKFLNAIKLNVYKANIGAVAGDFTGKAIVPIVKNGDSYEAELFGVHRKAGSPEELAVLERDIADVGYYSEVMSAADTERLATDPGARDELLHRLMNARMEEWMQLATDRLAGGDVPLFVIPGNDDDFGIDPILDRAEFFPQNADGKVLDMPGGLQMHGLRLVEQHPLGHPAGGARGRAVRPARRARRAGARPAPGGVHDPRPAARLGARHGADPRREPASRPSRPATCCAGRWDRRRCAA